MSVSYERVELVCPSCKLPMIRTQPVGFTGHGGWYYGTEKRDWCAECRLGVRWFTVEEIASTGVAYAERKGWTK